MPAWPGGPCPRCGEEMPPRVVHCRSCRHLLNDELDDDTVVEPAFVPLKEIVATVPVEPRGFYDECPACGRELRISRKYAAQVVRCKHCDAGFTSPRGPDPVAGRRAYYADCPHCRQELRIGVKYWGVRVACKHCGGELTVGADAAETSPQ